MEFNSMRMNRLLLMIVLQLGLFESKMDSIDRRHCTTTSSLNSFKCDRYIYFKYAIISNFNPKLELIGLPTS